MGEKKYLVLFFLFTQTTLWAQFSRLRMEPLALIGLDFNRINPNTMSSTPIGFNFQTSFGNKYSKKSGWSNPPLGVREFDTKLLFGLLISYEYTPKTDLRFGLIFSQAGGMAYFRTWGFGNWVRVINFPIMINYQLIQMNKIRSDIELIGGVAITIPIQGFYPDSRIVATDSVNVYSFTQTDHVVHPFGLSIQGGVQMKHKLNNGNDLNVKLFGSLGVMPIYSVDYTTTINTDKYYTEIISNGSYISIGVGYEFNFLKKYFGYTKVQKKQGTKNGYYYH